MLHKLTQRPDHTLYKVCSYFLGRLAFHMNLASAEVLQLMGVVDTCPRKHSSVLYSNEIAYFTNVPKCSFEQCKILP